MVISCWNYHIRMQMKDKKNIVNVIMIIIVIYLIVGIILPFIFKYAIFESTTFSNLSNNEWAGFLGSYVGGILGGLGTLISVFITVKESREMQIDNKKDMDKKILDDKEEREAERKEDKKLEGQRERREFAEDIAVYIGKYITHISKYYYASRWAERINSDFRQANDELRKVEGEILALNRKIDKIGVESAEFVQLDIEKTNLLDKKRILERKYNERLKEKERNSIEGNRTEANECFFILKTKLYNIKEANSMLCQMDVLHKEMFRHLKDMDEDWLEKNTELLVKEYNKFKISYEEESIESIPNIFFSQ